MIIKKYSGSAWVNQAPQTTAAQLFTDTTFATSIFDANTKLKPAYLPDSVFDSLYFFKTTTSGNSRNLAAEAFGDTFTTNPKRSSLGYYFVATSALNLLAESSALATVFSINGCSTTGGSNILTLGVANSFITVGMTLVGTNIPSGTTVTSITNSTTLVMSNNATGTGGGITVQFQRHFQTVISGGEESNTYVRTFTLTSGSTSVTTGDTNNLLEGMRVSGTGIPTGATIATINVNGTAFTLSANATTGGAQSLTFNPQISPASVSLETGDWFIITKFTGLGTSVSPYIATFAIVNNTYELMKGAGASTAGAPGLVPAPQVANISQFLQGNGTWATPTNTTAITFGAGTATSGTTKLSFLSRESSDITAAKYTLLKAGTNVTFTTNVAGEATISSTDTNTTYTFEEGSTDGAFSVTPLGGSASSVAIHGLGSAAYTASGDYAAASHAHGSITSDGKIGTTAGVPIITTTNGVLAAGTFSNTAGSFAAGNDSRFHTRSHTMTSTNDHTAGNWKVFYSNATGNVVELTLGGAGTVLKSNGATSAPSWQSDNNDQYTAGTGLTEDQNEFSVDYPVYYDATTLPTSGVPTGAIGFLG
jgi:hypothetical protein